LLFLAPIRPTGWRQPDYSCQILKGIGSTCLGLRTAGTQVQWATWEVRRFLVKECSGHINAPRNRRVKLHP
jgi:hypothetical protein